MEATEGSEESEKRQVLDTPGLKKLIAKVKKGDADNAGALYEHNLSAEAHPDIRSAIPDVDENLDLESRNPVENRAVAGAINGKQDALTEMTDQEVEDLINSL